jgi:pimeloyl-ACP methyl ester carboxylesterase
MTQPLPIVLVPGLLASARLYGEQLPELWRWGPVTIADHTRDHSMAAIARRGGRLDEVIDLLLPVLIHRDRQDDAGLRRLVRLMAEDIGPEAFIRQQQAIMDRPDARPRLAGIGYPTLVLVGDGDELIPPDRSAEIASGIHGARLVMVPECGHLSTLERPQQVTQALVEWLQA